MCAFKRATGLDAASATYRKDMVQITKTCFVG